MSNPREQSSVPHRLHRCAWATSALLVDYHDREWGVPMHDDLTLFEFLTLEGAQAGLSWETVLRKRDKYRSLFDGFDPARVATYGEEKIAALLADPGIIRNRLKIRSTILNARAFLTMQQEFGSFDTYLWSFMNGVPIHEPQTGAQRVTRTPVSDRLSKDLAQRGFKFVGTTICYALMQAVGMVNDHELDCYRRREVAALG